MTSGSTSPGKAPAWMLQRAWLTRSRPFLFSRDQDLGGGSRSFAVGEYIIVYCIEGADVFIRVVHGRRDLETLFDQ